MVAGDALLPHRAPVMSSTRRTDIPVRYISLPALPPYCSPAADTALWWPSQKILSSAGGRAVWRLRRSWWGSSHSVRSDTLAGPHSARTGPPALTVPLPAPATRSTFPLRCRILVLSIALWLLPRLPDEFKLFFTDSTWIVLHLFSLPFLLCRCYYNINWSELLYLDKDLKIGS